MGINSRTVIWSRKSVSMTWRWSLSSDRYIYSSWLSLDCDWEYPIDGCIWWNETLYWIIWSTNIWSIKPRARSCFPVGSRCRFWDCNILTISIELSSRLLFTGWVTQDCLITASKNSPRAKIGDSFLLFFAARYAGIWKRIFQPRAEDGL